ncbi:MAG TPA: cation transporter [Acidobacteriaceae bacterium]|jgi:copper chaperone CopZ|nr:cation transporter [Acidobacteriaceae bacterium]
MKEVTLRVDNMHCGACVRRVTQALGKVDGVRVDEVRIGAARIKAPDDLPESVLVNAVQQAGYSAVVEH